LLLEFCGVQVSDRLTFHLPMVRPAGLDARLRPARPGSRLARPLLRPCLQSVRRSAIMWPRVALSWRKA